MSDVSNLTKVHEFRCIFLVHNLAVQRKFYEETFGWPIINDWGYGILYDTGGAVFELITERNCHKVTKYYKKD